MHDLYAFVKKEYDCYPAEDLAKIKGIPRSQLFAKALEEFISSHRKESITEKYIEEIEKGIKLVIGIK